MDGHSFVMNAIQWWSDAQQFAALYLSKTKRTIENRIDVPFITKMIMDEMQELIEAKSLTEQVDACLDAVYYIFDHLVKAGEKERLWVENQLPNLNVVVSNHESETAKLWTTDEVKNVYEYVRTVCEFMCGPTLIEPEQQAETLLRLVTYLVQPWVGKGIDLNPVWQLIHCANMCKFGEGGYMREDGKWMKPPNFIPPDQAIEKELARQLNQ